MKNSLPQFTCLSLLVSLAFFSCLKDKGILHRPNSFDQKIQEKIFVSEWSVVNWSNDHATYGNHIQEAPELTEAVLENAVILRFIKWEANESLFAVPLSLNEEAMITMVLQPGEVELYYFSDVPLDAPEIQARYIIITPDEANALEGMDYKQVFYDQLDKRGVDVKDYEEVADYLEIK